MFMRIVSAHALMSLVRCHIYGTLLSLKPFIYEILSINIIAQISNTLSRVQVRSRYKTDQDYIFKYDTQLSAFNHSALKEALSINTIQRRTGDM